MLLGISFWIIIAILYVAVGIAGVYDIVTAPSLSWEKLALLLVFVHLFFVGKGLRKLDEKVDQLRMWTLASELYLNIEFRNRSIDLAPGFKFGDIISDDLKRGLFRDKLLDEPYACRDGRKITLADDLELLKSRLY